MFKKIVAIGPESTGKSTLCAQLAHHYNTLWVPEFAREYLVEYGMAYTFENLLTIAQGQVALEDRYAMQLIENGKWKVENENVSLSEKKSLLFIDTDMYVMKVWCEFVFDKCHNWILNQIASRKYDLYLLCNVDLPWVKDELREYPDVKKRNKLYHHYKELMINQPIQWIEVSGDYQQRLRTAINAIDSITS